MLLGYYYVDGVSEIVYSVSISFSIDFRALSWTLLEPAYPQLNLLY